MYIDYNQIFPRISPEFSATHLPEAGCIGSAVGAKGEVAQAPLGGLRAVPANFAGILMGFVSWFMVMYGDLWIFMVIYGDVWWFMVIYGDLSWI